MVSMKKTTRRTAAGTTMVEWAAAPKVEAPSEAVGRL